MLLFPFLYLAGFLITIVGLVVWFYFRRNDDAGLWFQRLVFLGLALYLGGLFMTEVPIEFKVSSLVRDLTIIGIAGILFNFLIRKRPAFFFGLAALGVIMFWYYQNYLKPTATFTSLDVQELQLDPDGELLVEMNSLLPVSLLNGMLEEYDLLAKPAFTMDNPGQTELDDYYTIDLLPGKMDQLPEIYRKLYFHFGVDWVEPNEVIYLDPVEEENYQSQRLPDNIREKYGINDPGIEELWSFDALGMDKLYDYLRETKPKPKRPSLVAILDTGVDAGHEDLKANFKSIAKKHDKDPHRHGTHCAGIAGSVSNNGKGVASYSHNNAYVRISSVRVLTAMGSGTQRSIINGILEAADKGADVISMSLGGRSSQTTQRAYIKAVKYATRKNAIVIAAAGNSNRNAKDYTPVNVPGVIGVSALDANLNRAIFSNTVEDIEMGVAAPGVDILSTTPGGNYAKFSGTSMATPYVAGLVGMLKSLDPTLTAEQVYKILDATGKETATTRETGHFIQPYDAVRALR